VRNDARAGIHSGPWQLTRAKRTPVAASASRCGVRTEASPAHPIASARCWSAITTTTLGVRGMPGIVTSAAEVGDGVEQDGHEVGVLVEAVCGRACELCRAETGCHCLRRRHGVGAAVGRVHRRRRVVDDDIRRERDQVTADGPHQVVGPDDDVSGDVPPRRTRARVSPANCRNLRTRRSRSRRLRRHAPHTRSWRRRADDLDDCSLTTGCWSRGCTRRPARWFRWSSGT